ncbi:hypothetical protein VB774_20445 [Pseudanabaena galeata UHCC 0370]|uniref:Uncharacterized protein n=1 Tax=Pseudanabaena galeata UHCC 0370 TaxID=3110310 RepID=A0ABU5TNZ1_9CYAN|nr:hypothetical protein [Pseudanabaena galeata]MEA5480005.1 hypothetical protein [Pseudanabaena galeata UHCC 0370]
MPKSLEFCSHLTTSKSEYHLVQFCLIVQVETSGNFERQFRILFKRYRKIRSDVQPVIEKLQSGEVLGDRLSGLDIVVFKVRVKNSDIQKGKSGGYRLIY